MDEAQLRQDLVRFAKSLFDRGYSVGSSGNISVAVDGGFLITPTNSCLGFLDMRRISKLDGNWRHLSGDAPSKEVFLHRAFYDTRPGTGAVVHLHSTYSIAISCHCDTDPDDAIASLTPYVVMRVGRVKMLPYVRPGDPEMGEFIRELGGRYAAVLLANHGPTVAAKDLSTAVFATEELEETAKLLIRLKNQNVRHLDAAQIEELQVFDAPR